jgi:tetratricopeptide (TPR) repeat protein
MKLRLTILTLFIFSLATTAFGQRAKIEGYVSTDKGVRVAGVRIVVTPGGQAGTTDNKGHFAISLPDDIKPGQAARISVERVGWVIFNPMFGNCDTKSAERNYEPLRVIIVPKGSLLALSPKRISEVVARWSVERNKQLQEIHRLHSEVTDLKREQDEYAFLRKYAEEYGITLDKLISAANQWAQIKEGDDKEERALKEYWQKHYDSAARLALEAGQEADAELERANQQKIEASRKKIKRNMIAGDSFYAEYKFSEALAAYSGIEQLFEARKISKEDFTEEWAEVKLLLGNTKGALGIRVEGEAGPRLLTEALDDYRQATSFYTRAQSPPDWAMMQNNLGVVLSYLGERANGSESIEYLNESLAAYQAALEVYTREQSPQDWADTQNNLGVVMNDLGVRKDGDESIKYLNDAAAAYRSTLEVYTRDRAPQAWTDTQNNLGNVLSDLGERVEASKSIEYLNEAAAIFRATLKVRTREQLPQDWAATQNNLGVVLYDLGVRGEASKSLKNLNEAAAAYQAALEVYTREQSPQDWAAMQNNLGNVLRQLGVRVERSGSIKYLSDAAAAYHSALEVYTRKQSPQDWASTQSNLGVVLSDLGERTGGSKCIEYLDEAAAAYRSALEVYTRTQLPQEWARAQSNLGIVLNDLGERTEGTKGVGYLNEAVAAYHAVLEVRTRAQLPQDWAMTQNNLGNVLRTLGERAPGSDSIRYLNDSAAAFRAALEVYTRDQLPQDWAMTQNSLGVTLSDLGKRIEEPKGIKHLNEAAAAYHSALEVYTRAQLPQEWAMTQKNLAFTYLLLKDWPSASEAYANLLQTNPDDAEAYGRAASLYHNMLFKFDQAFALHQQWLARHQDDISAQAHLAEASFTTAQFSECEQGIAALLSQSKISDSTKTALRAIEIASLLALGQSKQVPSRLDALIEGVAHQPPTFKIEWNFDGTRYFIAHSEKLLARRIWLGHLLDALASKDQDTMLKALQEVRSTYKA